MVLLASPILRRLFESFSIGNYRIQSQGGLFEQLYVSDIYEILGGTPRREMSNGHRNS